MKRVEIFVYTFEDRFGYNFMQHLQKQKGTRLLEQDWKVSLNLTHRTSEDMRYFIKEQI